MPDLVYVYRGVHGKHPALHHARLGQVIPGDLNGDLTPEEHNQLSLSEASPFTSWTFRLDLARHYARKYLPSKGVVLRTLYDQSATGSSWSWVQSPDLFHEQEVLLRGVRMNLEVLEC